MAQQYGLQLVGNVRVFRKDREVQNPETMAKYKVSNLWFNVSQKLNDGTYDNVSMNLIFPKDQPKPDNNTIITITEAFPMISGQGQYKRIVFYVKSWLPAE